mgnify:CR=1 FL=1
MSQSHERWSPPVRDPDDGVVHEGAVGGEVGVVELGEGPEQGVGRHQAADEVVCEPVLDGHAEGTLDQGLPGVRGQQRASLVGGGQFDHGFGGIDRLDLTVALVYKNESGDRSDQSGDYQHRPARGQPAHDPFQFHLTPALILMNCPQIGFPHRELSSAEEYP